MRAYSIRRRDATVECLRYSRSDSERGISKRRHRRALRQYGKWLVRLALDARATLPRRKRR